MAKNEMKLNLDGMEHLYHLLESAGAKYVKVGVLGSTNQRVEGQKTNAEIGFIQEFGRYSAPKIPARSFLRVPLRTHIRKKLQKSKEFSKENVEKAIKQGKADILLKKLGALGEQIVLEAFDTSGDGKWEPNAAITVALKGSDKPLIDTGELRKSITSQVVKK